jgi:DNA adenine methylase
MPITYSPLRYPGGKGKLAKWVAEFMRHNNISGGVYIEPYAGGAAVALHLLLEGYVNHIIINDADPVIYRFWWAILNEPEAFIYKIKSTDVTIDSRLQQIEIVNNYKNFSKLEVGFAAFFLNRTNRSGILKAGVIGGKKENLIRRIEHIAEYASRITLLGIDALELLRNPPIKEFKKALIYLDPPYFNKGSQLYRNFYNPEDHKAIRDAVKKLNIPWIVTYDNCSEISELYSEFPTTEFSITYSTHLSRKKGAELLIHHPELMLSTPPSAIKSA